MAKEKTVGIDGCVINNIYSGFYERVYYAGMPSPESFSVIYETAYVRENPDSRSVVPHASDASIINVQDRRQLFFPLDTTQIEFPSRRSCKFEVKSVSPKELTVIVNEK